MAILKRIGMWVCCLVSGVSFVLGIYLAQRPFPVRQQRELAPGVQYLRLVIGTGGEQALIHLITVDLTTPGLHLKVSAGAPYDGHESRAATVAQHAEAAGMLLAVNANYFYPFEAGGVWPGYPQVGEPVNLVGQSIMDGVEVSAYESGWPVLCVGENGRVTLQAGPCAPDTRQSVAGDSLWHRGGERPLMAEDGPYPRSAVGLDPSGTQLVVIVADGKQPGYSQGVTRQQLWEIAQAHNVTQLLNLDGGGSTTLVWRAAGVSQLLNSPAHRRIPRLQRPVGNVLGVVMEEE